MARAQYIVRARAARSSPSASATSRSRTLPERPDTPSRPDSRSSTDSASSTPVPVARAIAAASDGSASPERVAMTRPSSGVRPMEVSTDRPPRTAAAEQPAPSWNVTSRARSGASPSTAVARSAIQAWARPWKPYRRSPYRSTSSPRIAYRAACAGIRAWNAVSNDAVVGTPGPSTRRDTSIASSADALCSGARTDADAIAATTLSSTNTGRSKAPPWTIRCPTASSVDTSRVPSVSQARNAVSTERPGRPPCSTVQRATRRQSASPPISRRSSFTVELPQLTARTRRADAPLTERPR